MKCTNCGLPLSPTRTVTHCPRCGIPLHTSQNNQEQAMPRNPTGNGFQQPPWGQMSSSTSGPFVQQRPPEQVNLRSEPTDRANQTQQPVFLRPPTGDLNGFPMAMPPRPPQYPYQTQRKRKTPRPGFLVAGLCLVLAALLLILVTVLAFFDNGNVARNTSSTNTTTIATNAQISSPTVSSTIQMTPTPGGSASLTPTGTTYPGQQYIDHAQMVTGVDPKTLAPQQSTDSFKAGTNMYVAFVLHPPSQGGAVCSIWYLEKNQVTVYNFNVSGNGGNSYTYAMYSSGSTGAAYVELYWASNKSCLDKVLAQSVSFTVTT